MQKKYSSINIWIFICIKYHTFRIRASADVLVTKYECITLYGWIPLAALKLFKCMHPWSLISHHYCS